METIGNRAYKEIKKRARENGISPYKEAEKLGVNSHSLSNWGKDYSPSAFYLAKMYYEGYDVIYILTGRKEHGDKL